MFHLFYNSMLVFFLLQKLTVPLTIRFNEKYRERKISVNTLPHGKESNPDFERPDIEKNDERIFIFA